jgi:hypothetical protein
MEDASLDDSSHTRSSESNETKTDKTQRKGLENLPPLLLAYHTIHTIVYMGVSFTPLDFFKTLPFCTLKV